MSSTTSQDPIPDPPVDVTQVLQEIAAGQLESGRIAELSDPSRTQLRDFASSWSSLSVELRRELIREMARQADQNLALDFSRFFLQLLDDPDAEVRAVAVRGLWETDSVSTLERISSMAVAEESAAVQEAIAGTLARYSYMVELEEIEPEDAALVQRALSHLIESGASWMVRRRALESAAFMSKSQSIKELIQSAYDSDFEQERAGALKAMGNNLDPRWLPIVKQELTNEDPDIRCEAARAAGAFGDPDMIEQLSRMIEDDDEEIQEVSIRSIGEIGGRQGIDMLRYLETQVSEELKPVVETALEEAQFQSDSAGLEIDRD